MTLVHIKLRIIKLDICHAGIAERDESIDSTDKIFKNLLVASIVLKSRSIFITQMIRRPDRLNRRHKPPIRVQWTIDIRSGPPTLFEHGNDKISLHTVRQHRISQPEGSEWLSKLFQITEHTHIDLIPIVFDSKTNFVQSDNNFDPDNSHRRDRHMEKQD